MALQRKGGPSVDRADDLETLASSPDFESQADGGFVKDTEKSFSVYQDYWAELISAQYRRL